MAKRITRPHRYRRSPESWSISSVEVIPDPLETAVGTMIGMQDDVSAPPASRRGMVRQELEDMIRRALERQPCVVSFSGGRDSSCILALACLVARRERLPLPVPVTVSYPGDPATYEDEWQTLVVRHLGLSDWVRLPAPHPDSVGVDAMFVLNQIGLRFPPNGYLSLPVARVATGGTVLTGIGGDELFGSPAATWLRLLLRLDSLSQPAVRRAISELLPGRRRRVARSMVGDEAWLRPTALESAISRMAREDRNHPVESIAVRRWVRSRYYQACYQTIQRVCGLGGSEAVTPLLQPRVVSAIAAEAAIGGFRSRAEVMSRFFSDVLPMEILQRRSKAVFTRSLAAASTRSFVSTWDGNGVDPDLVDPVVLRAEWSSTTPDFRSNMLLQQAALASGWAPD